MADSRVTINVTLHEDWRWRIGFWLVRMGLRVMGAKLDVVASPDPE